MKLLVAVVQFILSFFFIVEEESQAVGYTNLGASRMYGNVYQMNTHVYEYVRTNTVVSINHCLAV